MKKLELLPLALLTLASFGLGGLAGARPAPAPPSLNGGDENSGGSVWGSSYFPNVPLVTQDGETVHFFDDLIKDKVVVINFIYTSCPDSCPLETARLAEVQEILGDRVGQDVFMYSISIDPETDTPEVLKEYAQRYQAGPGWTFLTGKRSDVTLLRKKLGLYFDDIDPDSNDHNLSMMIGNQKTGRWMKRSPFENPYVLADQIGDWLHNWKAPREGGRDYKDAPALRNITRGENIFRTRCATCHGIGATDGVKRVGPDLLGAVERHDREWLERWITEPDVMMAEKDPMAMGLFEAYNRVPMPNMRLTPADVDGVIEYIETESRRVAVSKRIEEVAKIDPDAPAPASATTTRAR